MAEDISLSINELDKEFSEGRYKNLYLLFGKEKNLIDEYKNKIINSALSDAERDMNLEIINKDNYDPSDISNIINSVPFFSERRVIVFDTINFLNHSELYDMFLSIPEETIIIVLEEDIKKNSKGKNDSDDGDDEEENTSSSSSFDLTKFKKEIDKEKFMQINFDKATDNIVEQKVLNIFDEYNLKISKLNINYLSERTGGDLNTIINEASKLANYAKGKKEVTKDDIDLLVAEKLEETIFDLINDLTNKNMTGVQKKYKALLYAGNADRAIMPLVAWQYMLIYEVKLGMLENKSQKEIETLTGQKTFTINKASNIARKIDVNKLKAIIRLCNEVSIGFTKGDNNFDLLLDKIVNL